MPESNKTSFSPIRITRCFPMRSPERTNWSLMSATGLSPPATTPAGSGNPPSRARQPRGLTRCPCELSAWGEDVSSRVSQCGCHSRLRLGCSRRLEIPSRQIQRRCRHLAGSGSSRRRSFPVDEPGVHDEDEDQCQSEDRVELDPLGCPGPAHGRLPALDGPPSHRWKTLAVRSTVHS